MKDLRNHEFEELYCIIIDYMDKQQLKDDNINTAFEHVKPHKKRFVNMRRRSPSKYSIKNKELTHLRNQYLISLRLRVQSFLLSQSISEREAAKEIQHLLNPYGREFYVPTIINQSRFADNLKTRLKKSSKFKEAIAHLHLTELLDSIIKMTVEIKENHGNRMSENHKIKSKRKGVREEAYRDMKIMTDTINVAILINRHNQDKKALIEALITSINAKLQDFRTLMRSRNTKRKNKKEVEAALAELINLPNNQLKLLSEGVENSKPISGLDAVSTADSSPDLSANDNSSIGSDK